MLSLKKKLLIAGTLLATLVAVVGISCLEKPHLDVLAIPRPCNVWAKLPLRVHVFDVRNSATVERAIGSWNAVSGNTVLFVMTRDIESADVTVADGLWRSVNDAETVNTCVNGHVMSDISINSVIEPDLQLNALEHELGHALGLGHYDSDTSVMSANLDPGLMSGNIQNWEDKFTLGRPRKPRASEALVAISLRQ